MKLTFAVHWDLWTFLL